MEFLVEIQVSLPPELDPEIRDQLLTKERERGFELKDSGVMVRIWRIPGRIANVGIWRTADATALHEAIASLPLFPLIDARVTPLALHHLEADRREQK